MTKSHWSSAFDSSICNEVGRSPSVMVYDHMCVLWESCKFCLQRQLLYMRNIFVFSPKNFIFPNYVSSYILNSSLIPYYFQLTGDSCLSSLSHWSELWFLCLSSSFPFASVSFISLGPQRIWLIDFLLSLSHLDILRWATRPSRVPMLWSHHFLTYLLFGSAPKVSLS